MRAYPASDSQDTRRVGGCASLTRNHGRALVWISVEWTIVRRRVPVASDAPACGHSGKTIGR